MAFASGHSGQRAAGDKAHGKHNILRLSKAVKATIKRSSWPAYNAHIGSGRDVALNAESIAPVAVVGSGIMGLATATQLRKAYPNLPIDLISDRNLTETTSYGSGGAPRSAQLDKTDHDQ